LSLAVWTSRKEEYIPCTMNINNSDWERGWFYLCNAELGLPPTLARCSRRGPPPGTTGCPRPAPGVAGLARGRAEEAGGPRADCGVCPHQPPPPAGRPLDGEAAPHLRDDRGRGPRRAGEIAVAARSLPAGVCIHPGAVRHRPQVWALRRHGRVGARDAPHWPTGERSS
jgi:hypothetical protein